MNISLTRKQMMSELGVKYVLVLLLYGGVYTPISIGPMSELDKEYQESVISLMGFLMAAAIIGAFELSYTRTNLDDKLQRYLAHFTKFTLYSSILLLIQIAVMAFRDDIVFGIMIMASMPISIALIAYDFWDALRALDGQYD